MQYHQDIETLQQVIAQEALAIHQLRNEIAQVIIGQDSMVERLLIGVLAKGHILLEGMPGLAKTLAIKTLAQAVDAQFSRIQFTPDLLPSDVVGTMVYNPADASFSVKKGPVFANFVLADEINRAPAKVQSALLEAMQERQVTIGSHSYALQEPFLVMATQNPIEQEGAYPLPEAQLDRFLLKVNIDYPTRESERQIIRLNLGSQLPQIRPVSSAAALLRAREIVQRVYVDEKIEQYILDLVIATRRPEDYGLAAIKPLLAYGASPRAGIGMAQAARALAFLRARAYVTPDDVRAVCFDVLRHRIGLTFEAEAEQVGPDQILSRLIGVIKAP